MRMFLIGILFSVAALAQTASFEAATIKPAGPEEVGISGGDGRNGVLKIWNMTLRQCIGSAYRVPESLVVAGPPWVGKAGYDILARAGQPLGSLPTALLIFSIAAAARHRIKIRRLRGN